MSRRKQLSVRALASKHSIDVDEVLIALWDAGFDSITGPNDKIPYRDLQKAQQALGLATRHELQSSKYWMALLNLNENKFKQLLVKRGFVIRSISRVVPPKSVSVLKAEARLCGIDPMTGIKHQIDTKPKTKTKDTIVPFIWRTPGHERKLRWLTKNEIIAIHSALIDDFANSDDPISPPGILHNDLLESAAFRPQTANGDILKYPTIETSAAALFHSLTLNHAFCNGNKRTALVSMFVFLDENNLFPMFNQDEAFKLVINAAQHHIVDSSTKDRSDREVLAIADWICRHTRVLEKGERVMPWRKLRRILADYNCSMKITTGNRFNITRKEESRGIFGFKKTIELKTKVSYSSDGRDVDKHTIRKIRADLHLDDQHGVDSGGFYSKNPDKIIDFITLYRKTLRRLARM